MTDGWKSAIAAYIQQHNRMDLEYDLDPLVPLVADARYLSMQRERLRRVADMHRERRTRPAQCETRGRLLHVLEHGDGLQVYVRLHKKYVYHDRYIEERIEREKLTIALDGGRARLVRIEPDLSERLAFQPELPRDARGRRQLPEEPAKTKPQPLINSGLVHAPLRPNRSASYNRSRAVQYANRWWNGANPDFIEFEVDCTNFISQCLFAGEIPMNYTGRRDSGWWYRGKSHSREDWSYSWAVSNSFTNQLAASKSGLHGEEVRHPGMLTLGDVITYDWDGDGRFTHSVIVTAFDPSGSPLVNAHTTNSRYRYWDYRDSYAWSERTSYRFFHIPDLV